MLSQTPDTQSFSPQWLARRMAEFGFRHPETAMVVDSLAAHLAAATRATVARGAEAEGSVQLS